MQRSHVWILHTIATYHVTVLKISWALRVVFWRIHGYLIRVIYLGKSCHTHPSKFPAAKGNLVPRVLSPPRGKERNLGMRLSKRVIDSGKSASRNRDYDIAGSYFSFLTTHDWTSHRPPVTTNKRSKILNLKEAVSRSKAQSRVQEPQAVQGSLPWNILLFLA